MRIQANVYKPMSTYTYDVGEDDVVEICTKDGRLIIVYKDGMRKVYTNCAFSVLDDNK